jgi:hypothetical protein
MPRSIGTLVSEVADPRLVPGPCLLHFRGTRDAGPRLRIPPCPFCHLSDRRMQVLPREMQDLLRIGSAGLPPPPVCVQIQP